MMIHYGCTIKGKCRPLVPGEQAHMLQIYDPCNLMSNPSLTKFLSTRRGNRHKQENGQQNATKYVVNENEEIKKVALDNILTMCSVTHLKRK